MKPLQWSKTSKEPPVTAHMNVCSSCCPIWVRLRTSYYGGQINGNKRIYWVKKYKTLTVHEWKTASEMSYYSCCCVFVKYRQGYLEVWFHCEAWWGECDAVGGCWSHCSTLIQNSGEHLISSSYLWLVIWVAPFLFKLGNETGGGLPEMTRTSQSPDLNLAETLHDESDHNKKKKRN